MKSNIYYMGEEYGNDCYIMREDLIPYSFGGNKARKGKLFFEEIDKGDYDCVVTYGSSHSNHCRIIGNLAASRGIKCYIIGPDSVMDCTNNTRMMKLFEVEMENVPVEKVSKKIEDVLSDLREQGKKPYFIPGGGHGNIGTHAYVQCYEEIKEYEKENDLMFDYIFFATGTGTTHAGLVCGQIQNKDERKIVGISIARSNPRGRNVVLESINEYLQDCDMDEVEDKTVFIDSYVGEGYGKNSKAVKQVIKEIMIKYGIPLDSTYTGKAYYGMRKYLEDKKIKNKKVLFIHTGGTPLFFDDLQSFID